MRTEKGKRLMSRPDRVWRPARPAARATRTHTFILAIGGAALLLATPAARSQVVGSADTTPPSIEYGPLYSAVELSSIFPDSKTFPDLLPDEAPSAVVSAYEAQKGQPGFNLASFVQQHFSPAPVPPGPTVNTAPPGTGLLAYVQSLWPVLTQSAKTVPAYSTLQPEPEPYIVPGGRFREGYYWDSYFTALGLEQNGQHALSVSIVQDFAYDIDRYGHVPNGNRSYYLSRSQPPFFSYLVELVAKRDGASTIVTYLPELQKEYDYWMQGAGTLKPGSAYRNVVRLADGTVLNRNYDDRMAPRDESYKEDVQTAAVSNRPAGVVWQNLRATAASGWDFSSRWLADGKTLATVQTLNILPVDLNSLMFHLEATLAEGYFLKGDVKQGTAYVVRAITRAAAIRRLMWDDNIAAFTDYLWTEKRTTGNVTAATLYPLYVNLASAAQASAVASTVQKTLLQIGGILTTPVNSGQQWDSPNGWAPLQWIAVQAFTNYGNTDLAQTIATRWVQKNIAGYEQQGKLVEKYDVLTSGGDAGGGGEYATQIGFGWTNGVLVALTARYPALYAAAAAAKPPTTLAAASP
jgi:alpha,alpha-trehalase